MKETTRLLVSDIDWDIWYNDVIDTFTTEEPTDEEIEEAIEDALKELPTEFEIEDFPLGVLLEGDDDEICETIYDYIDENYGCCVKGFNWEEIEE